MWLEGYTASEAVVAMHYLCSRRHESDESKGNGSGRKKGENVLSPRRRGWGSGEESVVD